jgi:branched-chain amino acid transport system ATP-binding protein
MNFLQIHNFIARYADSIVLRGISLIVQEKEIVSVVGSNGSGKTTFLKGILGLLEGASGSIIYRGQEILGMGPHQIVEMGIAMIPEGRQIFPTMTVLENLEMGSYHRRAKVKRRGNLEKVFALFPVLQERKGQLAGTLSGGEQQMLALGRGLMSEPQLLMLDEPSLGLAPIVIREIFKIITDINSRGTTLLLVEQDVYHSLSISSRAYVLEQGKIVMEGKGGELLNKAEIKTSYLGL